MITGPEAIDRIHRLNLTAPRDLRFGSGLADRIPDWARAHGRGGLLIVCGDSSVDSGLLNRVQSGLDDAGVTFMVFDQVNGEPTADLVNQAAEQARQASPSAVIGLGGGSVVDAGKVVAALAVNPGPVEDYLEGVGTGRVLETTPLPHLAVPTTAGTGAEATKNAVIADYGRKYKKSMRDERMIPLSAWVDPELTVTVPAAVTAAGGMDTITQLIEPCLSAKRRPETTQLALEGLRLCREALPRCVRDPEDLGARSRMSLASLLSGVCLANAGLALAHGIASGMGAVCAQPHGLICGVLLPHTLRWNRAACEAELAEALGAFLNEPVPSPNTVDRGIEAVEALNRNLGLPPDFRHLHLDAATVDFIAENSMGSSMSGNPIPMTPDQTRTFLAGVM